MNTASWAPPFLRAGMLTMAEKEHREKIQAMTAHTPDSGCVARCVSKFEEGNKHSHRWQAALQATDEKAKKNSVYSVSLDDVTVDISNWKPGTISNLVSEGGFAGGAPTGSTATVKAFYRAWVPFHHNAHHIVPIGVLWETSSTPPSQRPRTTRKARCLTW